MLSALTCKTKSQPVKADGCESTEKNAELGKNKQTIKQIKNIT